MQKMRAKEQYARKRGVAQRLPPCRATLDNGRQGFAEKREQQQCQQCSDLMFRDVGPDHSPSRCIGRLRISGLGRVRV